VAYALTKKTKNKYDVNRPQIILSNNIQYKIDNASLSNNKKQELKEYLFQN
jgi:hypothetical protein